jgi:hypothetical protein
MNIQYLQCAKGKQTINCSWKVFEKGRRKKSEKKRVEKAEAK